MTRIVTGLERSGLAQRVADSKDARRTRVCATAKGTRLLQEARERRIQSLASHLKSLTDKELGLLNDAIGVLDRVLSEKS